MNPDAGDEVEDWFAKFEREAREAAQRRAAEEDAAGPPVAPVPPAATPPPLVQPPQLNNPVDAPAQPAAPPPPVWSFTVVPTTDQGGAAPPTTPVKCARTRWDRSGR